MKFRLDAPGEKLASKSRDLKERGVKTHNDSDSDKSDDNSKSISKKSLGKIAKKRSEKEPEYVYFISFTI